MGLASVTAGGLPGDRVDALCQQGRPIIDPAAVYAAGRDDGTTADFIAERLWRQAFF